MRIDSPMSEFVRNGLAAALAVACCGAVLAGCSQDDAGQAVDSVVQAGGVDVKAYPAPTYPQKDADGFYAVEDQIFVYPQDEIVTAANAFATSTAADFLASADGPNVNYSPISLYFALSMTAQGAQGETREQMMAFLQTADSPEMLSRYRALFLSMYTNPLCEMKLADSVWLSADGGPFKQEFVDCMTQDFLAEIFEADFGTAGADAAMSAWISEHTGNTLAPEVKTRPEWLIALVNTVYFKGSWQTPFNASLTSEGEFTLQPGSGSDAAAQTGAGGGATVMMDFMNLDASFDGHDVLVADEFVRAGLPFDGGAVMNFILPAQGVSVEDILGDEELFALAVAGEPNSYAGVRFSIPKFTFDTEFDMADQLQEMGLDLPFSDHADFSGMSEAAACISSVNQGTHIAIDEEGAEASAYTIVGVAESAAPLEPDSVIDFVCDRPFLYTITSPEGAVLFVGVVGNPAQ